MTMNTLNSIENTVRSQNQHEETTMTKKNGASSKRTTNKKGDVSKYTTKKNGAVKKGAARRATKKNKDEKQLDPKIMKAKIKEGKNNNAVKKGATGKATKRKKEEKQLDPEVIKAKLKERINSIPSSEKKRIRLEWTSKSISTTDEKSVLERVIVRGCYGPLDAQQMCQIQNQISSTQMTLSQAISLRSTSLQQKAIHRHESLRDKAKGILKQYKQGATVLELAKNADQPPMNVFRVILSEMEWKKNVIKKALRDPKKFKERERNELLAAESMDVISMVNQSEIKKHSEEFEDLLSAWLKQKGVRFVRQIELETEQKKEFGKAILTPDFLLLDHVFINGVQCHWIDCKALYGANLPFTIKKTKQQMARYVDHWGSGAIVYLQGFSEAIKIKDCAILNAHGALDGTKLNKLEEKLSSALNSVTSTTFNTYEGGKS